MPKEKGVDRRNGVRELPQLQLRRLGQVPSRIMRSDGLQKLRLYVKTVVRDCMSTLYVIDTGTVDT